MEIALDVLVLIVSLLTLWRVERRQPVTGQPVDVALVAQVRERVKGELIGAGRERLRARLEAKRASRAGS